MNDLIEFNFFPVCENIPATEVWNDKTAFRIQFIPKP